MRDGVSYISKRYGIGCIKCLISYDPKKLRTYITYLHKNNLQGYAMSKSRKIINR